MKDSVIIVSGGMDSITFFRRQEFHWDKKTELPCSMTRRTR